MPSYDRETMAQAVSDVHTGRFRSARQSALVNDVPESTLRDGLHGMVSIEERVIPHNRLTKGEEQVLVRWISDQQRHLVAPNVESCREIVTAMLIAKGDLTPLGEH
jgi:hypothetical protein